jgi:hypothetical protein
VCRKSLEVSFRLMSQLTDNPLTNTMSSPYPHRGTLAGSDCPSGSGSAGDTGDNANLSDVLPRRLHQNRPPNHSQYHCRNCRSPNVPIVHLACEIMWCSGFVETGIKG